MILDTGHGATCTYRHRQAQVRGSPTNTDRDWQNIFDTCKIEWNIEYTKTLNFIGCSAKNISLVRFVTILVEMKSKLNYILITSFKSLGITSSSLNISRFRIMLLRLR